MKIKTFSSIVLSINFVNLFCNETPKSKLSKLILIFTLAILIISPISAGEIITTNDFNIIEREAHKLNKDSLVLFDVDGTLIVPIDSILHPNGKDLFNRLTNRYTDRDLFREIRMKAVHKIVEDKSVRFIQDLQRLNIPVIAFTAAPAKIHTAEQIGNWRVNELKQFGFDFSSAFPYCDFLELPKNPNLKHSPLFKLGVLYSSFHSKGDILTTFLHQLRLRPNKIIFIDDERHHIQSVVTALDKLGIPCIGIHYIAANETLSNLNAELADIQINYFIEHNIWLGDEEGKELLKNK